MQGRQLLKKILRDLDGVPPMPQVIQNVMKVTQDPKSAANDLSDVISTDQALTANVLRLCNSAYYGLPRKVGSVNQAITYLGFRAVRNLVLTTFLGDVYKGSVAVAGYHTGGLWEHSVAVGIAAQLVCQKLRKKGADDVSFTCGLLHDVGKPILWKYAREYQNEILARVKIGGLSFPEAEREVLGFDHAALGAKVADLWNFPSGLVQAIALHHDPPKAQGDRFLSNVTHVANGVAVSFGAGISQQGLITSPLCRQALVELGLENNDLESLQEPLEDAFERASPLINVAESTE